MKKRDEGNPAAVLCVLGVRVRDGVLLLSAAGGYPSRVLPAKKHPPGGITAEEYPLPRFLPPNGKHHPLGVTCETDPHGVRKEHITMAKQQQSRSTRWPYVRRMAWDRDRKARAVCHICWQEIDYSLKPSSADLAWEPDHIVPVSMAPERELDLTNIAASHRKCNRARGNGTNGENVIGQQSRIW